MDGSTTGSVHTLESEVGPEVYRQLLVAFLAHLPRQLSDLMDAAEVGDVPKGRYVAHQLKGAALSFGAVELDGLAERVLQIGRDQDDQLRRLAEDIRVEVERLLVTLGPSAKV